MLFLGILEYHVSDFHVNGPEIDEQSKEKEEECISVETSVHALDCVFLVETRISFGMFGEV